MGRNQAVTYRPRIFFRTAGMASTRSTVMGSPIHSLRPLASLTSTSALGVRVPLSTLLIIGALTPLSSASRASSPRVGPDRQNSICRSSGSDPIPPQCRQGVVCNRPEAVAPVLFFSG
jgi:hypothetical protein